MKNSHCILAFLLLLGYYPGVSQQKTYDLQQLLKEGRLITYDKKVIPVSEGDKKGVSATGIVWLKDVNFSNGTIEIDLKGQDVFQKSFIGIAFHGVDTITYDAIYFRPFNFLTQDPVRKIHAVQYISEPDFTWHRLRDEQNGKYEKEVNPAPSPNDWFHIRIEVWAAQVTVYVNNAVTPSLSVNKLNVRNNGMIGIWNTGLNGEFANLVIRQ